jgi:hypothetical protein
MAILAQVPNPSRTVQERPAKRPLRKSPAGNGKAAVQDEARAALKVVNAEVRKAEHAATVNRKGTERAADLKREARLASDRAAVAVEKADERTTADAERALLAGKSIEGVNPGLDRARTKEKTAIAQTAMANVVHANLESRQRELDGAASYAREKRDKAIDAVIMSELPLHRLLAETQQAHDRLSYLFGILRRLLFERLVEGEDKRAVESIMRVPLPPHPDQGSPIDWNATPAGKSWDAMRAALAADADAPIKIAL